MTEKLLRILGITIWIGCAIFTAIWVHQKPEDIPLAAVVWTGGVLSYFLVHALTD